MTFTVGVIGGGQLCRLMGEDIARKGLDYKLVALDPTTDCPAKPYLEHQVIGEFNSPERIRSLARLSTVLTYEIELAGAHTLEELEKAGKRVQPSSETLRIIQDKYSQANFLASRSLPVPRTMPINQRGELMKGIELLGLPCMLKAREGSYDGRGNYLLRDEAGKPNAIEFFEAKRRNGKGIMIQQYVDFQKEISVIAARNDSGQIAIYPVGENIHADNILHTTIAPAMISEQTAEDAKKLAHRTLEVLHGSGVFGIEMFVDREGKVMINEIAPRVHNSGHYTFEACETSQFEQHLRAVCNHPLGPTGFLNEGRSVMHNILGDEDFKGGYRVEGLAEAVQLGASIHMYEKSHVKRQRKMGHFTFTGIPMNMSRDDILNEAARVREMIRFVPANGRK